jgi:hypothetical protein
MRCDVAIIGAGPYGLSAAAHLQRGGVDVRIFGRAMSFWQDNMPEGMFLRSPWVASHLSDPARGFNLDAFCRSTGRPAQVPLPLARFVEYGHWFQRSLVPDLDSRFVASVSARPQGFRLELEDGYEIDASRVVVAAGIDRFAFRPPQFDGMPHSLVSHSVEHKDLGHFRGRKVFVIGAGQSALESAALLKESGTEVEIVARSPVRFLHERQWMHDNRVISRMLYAPPDVGPALISHIVARPNYFKILPRRLQDRLHPRSIRPAGAQWLKPRLMEVPTASGVSITSAEVVRNGVRLTLDDGSRKEADHVLLATGYKVDISRYSFLAPEILSQVKQVKSYPVLSGGFESSVEGLYFIGAPAAWSFGPLLRFVAGADFAVSVLTRAITGSLRRSVNGALAAAGPLRSS